MIYDAWGYPVKRATGYLRAMTRYEPRGSADAIAHQSVDVEPSEILEECKSYKHGNQRRTGLEETQAGTEGKEGASQGITGDAGVQSRRTGEFERRPRYQESPGSSNRFI